MNVQIDNPLYIHVYVDSTLYLRKFPDTPSGATERYKHAEWLRSLGLIPIFPEDEIE